jgi:hypothetical protein
LSSNSNKLMPQLPSKIRDLIYGISLSDGFIERYGPGIGNSRVVLKQSLAHAPYLFFVYFQLLFWGFTSPSIPVPALTKDTNGNRHWFLRVRTGRSSIWNWFRDHFYPNGIKEIPLDVALYLNARVFAHLICGDGGWDASGLLLHLNSFSLEGVERFQAALFTNFNIKTSLRKKNANSWVIYIGAAELPKVRELVLPYLHSSMYYKVHAGPKPASPKD